MTRLTQFNNVTLTASSRLRAEAKPRRGSAYINFQDTAR